MWLKNKIRDAAVPIVLFGLSNLCMWENSRTSDCNNIDQQYDGNWRVASIEDSKRHFKTHTFISSQIENMSPWESSQMDTIKNSAKEKIILCLKTDDENSFTHKNVLESVEDPQNTILEYPLEQLFQKYWTDNKPHPLYVPWVAKNFRALLWKWGIEALDISQRLKQRETEITSESKYEIWDTLRFHLIEPSLVDKFPDSLKDQLIEDWFNKFSDKDSLETNNVKLYYEHNDWVYSNSLDALPQNENPNYIYDIVVKSLSWWKSALAVYRNWKLFMATYVSVWTVWRKTRTWQHEIIWKNPYKRSAKYENSPMPFGLNYFWWFYFHQWNVTWTPLSHGCVRLPWVYASVLYSLVKEKNHIDVFIDENLYKSK